MFYCYTVKGFSFIISFLWKTNIRFPKPKLNMNIYIYIHTRIHTRILFQHNSGAGSFKWKIWSWVQLNSNLYSWSNKHALWRRTSQGNNLIEHCKHDNVSVLWLNRKKLKKEISVRASKCTQLIAVYWEGLTDKNKACFCRQKSCTAMKYAKYCTQKTLPLTHVLKVKMAVLLIGTSRFMHNFRNQGSTALL